MHIFLKKSIYFLNMYNILLSEVGHKKPPFRAASFFLCVGIFLFHRKLRQLGQLSVFEDAFRANLLRRVQRKRGADEEHTDECDSFRCNFHSRYQPPFLQAHCSRVVFRLNKASVTFSPRRDTMCTRLSFNFANTNAIRFVQVMDTKMLLSYNLAARKL